MKLFFPAKELKYKIDESLILIGSGSSLSTIISESSDSTGQVLVPSIVHSIS